MRVRLDRTAAHRCPERRGSPDEESTHNGRTDLVAGMRTVLRITLDVMATFAVLLIVAVGVGIFGVVAESDKAIRRWPSLN